MSASTTKTWHVGTWRTIPPRRSIISPSRRGLGIRRPCYSLGMMNNTSVCLYQYWSYVICCLNANVSTQGYLHLALHGLKMCVGTRFRVALRIMEQLRQDVPEARKIWEYSFDTKDAGRGRVMRQLIEKDLQFERKMKKDIRGRKFTPDSVIPPKYFPN